jgi:hypothetical protein
MKSRDQDGIIVSQPNKIRLLEQGITSVADRLRGSSFKRSILGGSFKLDDLKGRRVIL